VIPHGQNPYHVLSLSCQRTGVGEGSFVFFFFFWGLSVCAAQFPTIPLRRPLMWGSLCCTQVAASDLSNKFGLQSPKLPQVRDWRKKNENRLLTGTLNGEINREFHVDTRPSAPTRICETMPAANFRKWETPPSAKGNQIIGARERDPGRSLYSQPSDVLAVRTGKPLCHRRHPVL